MLLSTALKAGRLQPPGSIVFVPTGVSSVTVSVAVDDVFALGVKFTVIVHDVPTASRAGAAGQSLVCAKSPALTAMLLMVTASLPVFANLTVLAAGAGSA